MKKLFYFLSLILAVCFTSCELDNYEEPNINLVGKVTYQGRPIYVRNNQITFRLYEPGWELSSSTYMNVQVAQDGTFSAGVYGGKTYKLERQANIGPWVNPTEDDVIIVDNYDGKEIDMPVTPYYLLDDAQATCNGRIVTASCKIMEVTPGKNIEKVGLYIGRNIITDDVRNLGQGGYTEVFNINDKDPNDDKDTKTYITFTPGSGQEINLSVDLSGFSINSTNNSLPQTGFAYARMGLKIAGIDAMVFTEPFKINFSK